MSLQPYHPTSNQPWNLQRVWMLHRRAAFGATWGELQRDVADGPIDSVSRILGGTTRLIGVPDSFAEMRQILASSAVASERPERLIAWWIYQMYFSPNPMRERLAIMWHNHFATSHAKVKNLQLMFEQNEVFREFGDGQFPSLLSATIKHPAMLKWLDGDKNKVGAANENLGRETLELFTLGVGHYSESDVKNASRALTGWSIKDDKFSLQDKWHDQGEKTILGRSGNFDGDGFLELATQHPATAKRLAWRLCSEFMSAALVTDELVAELADVLTNNDLNVFVAASTLLRSEYFFSNENLKGRIVDPESFVVGTVRALNIVQPPASTMVLADWLEQLGRKLFYPPNVGGWLGGKSWLNSRTTIARANFGAAVVQGNLRSDRAEPDLFSHVEKQIGTTDLKDAAAFYSRLLTGDAEDKFVEDLVAKAGDTYQQKLKPHEVLKRAVAMIIASPAAQLC